MSKSPGEDVTREQLLTLSRENRCTRLQGSISLMHTTYESASVIPIYHAVNAVSALHAELHELT